MNAVAAIPNVRAEAAVAPVTPGSARGVATLGWATRTDTAAAVLITIVGAGILLRLVWLALGLARLQRLRRHGSVATLPEELADLPRIVGAGAEIRWLDALAQPVTFGVVRPVVLLPASLAGFPLQQQRTVIAHELIHVQRRDWMWVVVEELVRALFWFHPAVWWLVSRVQLSREQMVDELTVTATSSRRAYMEALLAFADRAPVAPVTAFARRRHLFKRMSLMSKEIVMSSRHVAASCVAMALIVGFTSWWAAMTFPLEASPAVDSGAEQTAQPAPPPPPPAPLPSARSAAEGAVKPLHRVEAAYPAELRAASASGRVTLVISIDAAGNVTRAGVRGVSVTNGKETDAATMREITEALIRAATDAALQWRYEATGKASSANVTIAVRPPEDKRMRMMQGATAAPLFPNAVRIGGDIHPPTKLYHVAPEYPALARAARVEGVVIAEAVIDESGAVAHARVLRSIPLLDAAALDALKQWRFTPSFRDGKPVAVIVTITIDFRLDDDGAPPPPPAAPPPV